MSFSHQAPSSRKLIPSSSCELLAATWQITLEQLGNWNPSLNTTNTTECAPQAGYRYCMQAYNGALVPSQEPTATPTPELPIRSGATEDCLDYGEFREPNTCARFLYQHNITIAQLYDWNPAVGADCTSIWFGKFPSHITLNLNVAANGRIRL